MEGAVSTARPGAVGEACMLGAFICSTCPHAGPLGRAGPWRHWPPAARSAVGSKTKSLGQGVSAVGASREKEFVLLSEQNGRDLLK